MKNQINNIGWVGLILALIAALAFSSCKKDENENPKPSPPTITPITTIGATYQGGIVVYLDATARVCYRSL